MEKERGVRKIDFAGFPDIEETANMITAVKANESVKKFILSPHCLIERVATKCTCCSISIYIAQVRAGTSCSPHPVWEHARSMDDFYRNIGAIIAYYFTDLFLPVLNKWIC
jgi:hypothetical protein